MPKSSNEREAMIRTVLDDLSRLAEVCEPSARYALEENRLFFESLQSRGAYLRWCLRRAPRLRGADLLELTDFPLPQWEPTVLTELVKIERRSFPGLIAPLVTRLVDLITSHQRPLVLASLACGGMEVERQVIARLRAHHHPHLPIFVCVDRSDHARQVGFDNLGDLAKREEIEAAALVERIGRERLRPSTDVRVLFCHGNVFDLEGLVTVGMFDVVYHAHFRHHLPGPSQERLAQLTIGCGKTVLEYDGTRSLWLLIPQTIENWNCPVFLNAAVFSTLRFPRKAEIRSRFSSWHVSLYWTGYYLAEYRQAGDREVAHGDAC